MQPTYVEKRRALLRERLARLQAQIADLERQPARWAARRAVEIDAKHAARELAELEHA
jgi:hypothetical protein